MRVVEDDDHVAVVERAEAGDVLISVLQVAVHDGIGILVVNVRILNVHLIQRDVRQRHLVLDVAAHALHVDVVSADGFIWPQSQYVRTYIPLEKNKRREREKTIIFHLPFSS